MKIVHFTPTYFPSIGGIESVVKTLSSQMALDKHEVIVVCLTKHVISSSNHSFSAHNELFLTYYFVFLDLLNPKRIAFLVKLLRSSDVIHLHDPKLALLFILSFLFAPHKKFFLSTHGGFFHNKRFKILKSLYSRLWAPFALRKLTKVFAISTNDFHRFSRLSPIQNVLYSHNPVVMNPFNVNPYLHPKSLRHWLYWGRASSNKNLLGLLEFVKFMNNSNVYISLNICSRDSLRQLQIFANDNCLDNVSFNEKPTDETIARLISSSAVFVLPSTYEGFGLSLVEAASSGLIPIFNDISPINKLFANDIGLALDFTNHSGAVQSFLSYERSFLQNPGISHVINSCSSYSPSNIVNNMIKEYEYSLT